MGCEDAVALCAYIASIGAITIIMFTTLSILDVKKQR